MRDPRLADDASAGAVPDEPSPVRSTFSVSTIDNREEAKRILIRSIAEYRYPDVISLVRIEESLALLDMLPNVPLVDFIRTVLNVDVFHHGGFWYCKSLSGPSGHR